MRLGRSILEGETKNFSSGFGSGWRTTAFLAESVRFQLFFLSEGWRTSKQFFCPRVIFRHNSPRFRYCPRYILLQDFVHLVSVPRCFCWLEKLLVFRQLFRKSEDAGYEGVPCVNMFQRAQTRNHGEYLNSSENFANKVNSRNREKFRVKKSFFAPLQFQSLQVSLGRISYLK